MTLEEAAEVYLLAFGSFESAKDNDKELAVLRQLALQTGFICGGWGYIEFLVDMKDAYNGKLSTQETTTSPQT